MAKEYDATSWPPVRRLASASRTVPAGRWSTMPDTTDPIAAQRISDAFRDAERCSTAVDDTVTGVRSFADTMSPYHRTRDAEVLPMYDFTTQLATLEAPPPPEMQQLRGAVHGNRDAMDSFVSVTAGTMSPVEFLRSGQHRRHFRRCPG